MHVGLTKMTRSSAKNICESVGPDHDKRIERHCPELILDLMQCPNHSIHKTNMYGDRGHLCLTPFAGRNFYVRIPFHSICIEELVMTNIITFVRNSRIPVVWREASIKSHPTRSYNMKTKVFLLKIKNLV